MARITVEDCLKNVANRFELVLIASKRARQLARDGADPLVPAEGDKSTVIALREVAADLIDKTILEEHQKPSRITAVAEVGVKEGDDEAEVEAEVVAVVKDGDGEVVEDEISQEIIDETQKTESELEAGSMLHETTISDGSDSEE